MAKIQIGDKFESKNGQIGTIKNFNGVLTIEVKNSLGKITQKIAVDEIDLSKFKKVE